MYIWNDDCLDCHSNYDNILLFYNLQKFLVLLFGVGKQSNSIYFIISNSIGSPQYPVGETPL